MSQAWEIWIIGLLLGALGTLGLLLWRAKHEQGDERERNWKQSRIELISRLDKMDEALTIVIALNVRMQRAEENIAEVNEWKNLKAVPYIEAMPQVVQRLQALERVRNGKITGSLP